MTERPVYWLNGIQGVYIFRYDENYLASDGLAISVTMPKLRVPFESEILFPKLILQEHL